ncbi:hypothetical protein CCMA1212_002503 [Trichoderma ghanense]|uniref:Uncharacterized protein n=1 Tax=Trichoderma ghanense TaxID=65468 RepID=A0ABY2HAF8_9HYPO
MQAITDFGRCRKAHTQEEENGVQQAAAVPSNCWFDAWEGSHRCGADSARILSAQRPFRGAVVESAVRIGILGTPAGQSGSQGLSNLTTAATERAAARKAKDQEQTRSQIGKADGDGETERTLVAEDCQSQHGRLPACVLPDP